MVNIHPSLLFSRQFWKDADFLYVQGTPIFFAFLTYCLFLSLPSLCVLKGSLSDSTGGNPDKSQVQESGD